MPFTVSVTADTLQDAVLELAKALGVLREEPAVVTEPEAAPVPAPAPAPAPAATKTARTESKPDPEALRVEVRQILTPLMKTDKGAAARALISSFGSGLGSVPEDSLPDLLAKAKELANG